MALFGSDRVMLYNVKPWNLLGFGVPNFAKQVGTLSIPIAGLVDEIGQVQLSIMLHVDAFRTRPPSRNTVERIGTMINRVNTVLGGRQKGYNERRLESGHAQEMNEIFRVHPVPFFDGPVLRNRWMKEYNRLVMVAQTNAMQHADNNLALTLTKEFAQDIWQYFAEIKVLMGTELLGLKREDVAKDEFQFLPAMYDAYNPAGITPNLESYDDAGPIFSLPTEADVRPLMIGIPANLIIPNLVQYPIGPLPELQGFSGQGLTATETIIQPDAVATDDANRGAATGTSSPTQSTNSQTADGTAGQGGSSIGKPAV